MKRTRFRPSHRWALTAAGLSLMLSYASPAKALEEERAEAQKLESCDRRVCALLLSKDPKGEDLTCELSKTWAKSTIKEAETHQLRWGYGDARCSVRLNVSRAKLVAAVTAREFKLFVPEHTVNCIVEQDGKIESVKATLAPKIVFKDGKADKVWVNLSELEGPSALKATLWTAASLSDQIGLFHRPMVKAVNRYIHRHCPKKYGEPQQAAAGPESKPSKSPKKN